MCDPVTAIAAAGAVASTGAGLYESSQASSQLAATQNAQNKANSDWLAYQNRIHQQQAQSEDAARQAATGAQQDTLQKVAPAAQQAQQLTEQERLNTAYNQPSGTATDSSNPQGMLLSGEQSGNQQSMNSITSQVNQATQQARGRIAALATANSYGGSFGGLGTTTPLAFAQGGNDINLQNAMRQGNLKTYGVEQQVQPLQYTVGPGTEATMGLGKTLGGLGGSLAGFAGPRAVTDMGGFSGIGSGISGMFGSGASASDGSYNRGFGSV